MIRRCHEGWKVGPLFAATPQTAAELFAGLVARTDGGPVFLDVPGPNAAAVADRHGLREVFATARMYRGGVPALPLEWIFGVTTFELG